MAQADKGVGGHQDDPVSHGKAYTSSMSNGEPVKAFKLRAGRGGLI